MPRLITHALSAALLLPAAAQAQTAPAGNARAVAAQDTRSADAQAATGLPPRRIRSVTLTSRDQKCPPSTATDVVVCAVVTDPYRIPRQLRDSGPPAANQSWVNRAAALDQVGRVAGGLPDTCSAIGTGGQSGCALAANRQYAAEKRAAANGDSGAP